VTSSHSLPMLGSAQVGPMYERNNVMLPLLLRFHSEGYHPLRPGDLLFSPGEQPHKLDYTFPPDSVRLPEITGV
jgi:hypothetical protein